MDPHAIPISAVDFTPDETVVQDLREYIQRTAKGFGLDLGGLEGISIAENMRAFTRGFDTGFGTKEQPDISESAVGFTPEVLRDGRLGSHVILSRSIITAFAPQQGSQLKDEARYTIAHELAHADEHHRSGSQFGGELLELHRSPNEFQVGRRAVWGEYYACRKVAPAFPGILPSIEEVLVRSSEEFGNDCAAVRARLAACKDKERVHGDLCSSAFRFFIAAARLLGHLDGLENQFKAACRTAPVYLDDAKLTSTFEDLHSKLKLLWDSFPNWSSLNELQSILVAMDTKLKTL
jgi:hypothetical protein